MLEQRVREWGRTAAGAELVAMTVMSRTTLQIGAGGDVSHSVVQSAGAALLCGQAPAADPARPILLLYDASPAATQALELAIRLAGHPGGITVITLATDAARAAALRQRATARLQSESIAFRLRDLGAARTSAAIELLRREHGSLVLLPVDGTMPAGLSLQILLQRLGLPVLQVRAKGSEPA